MYNSDNREESMATGPKPSNSPRSSGEQNCRNSAAVPTLTIPDDNSANFGIGADLSDSDGDEDEDDGLDGSEVESFVDPDELDEDGIPTSFLMTSAGFDGTVDMETRARLQTLLEAAGMGKLSDPEVLHKLTSAISVVRDEAASNRLRLKQTSLDQVSTDSMQSLSQACVSGDVELVKVLLKQGRSIHETTEDGESLLSLAASSGYYELCQVLIAMNANVEDRGIKGDCTPLMEAACAGFEDIIKLLFANGADVNAKSTAGNTALHYAACNGHENAVRALIEARANVEEHNENGHTPLMEAASAGRVGVAKLLLEAGAGINTHSNEFKETALTLACYKGHLEMVKFLLQAGADQEHKTDEMHTALMEASMDGHVDVAKLLLDSGAQVNMPTESFESPLTLAACGGHVELASLLIERSANLEEANDEGYTPLMEAAREGHDEMCALLLAHGADINAQTEETQETALTLACCGGFLEVADFLIKAGADIELGCSTPLMEAAQEGHLELVKYLLKCGAKVQAKTQTGDTALTYACENGHTDVAEVLLEYGAELEHESEGGRTALMKAARVGHFCTVQFLINQGANVNKATTNNDHTVLSLACAGGHITVVELLLKHRANASHKLKDCSTMLIEASKGGHAQVVKLLLDWTGSSDTPSSEEMSPSSPSQSSLDLQPLPRVPMHGLSNFVPPQPQDPAIPFGSLSVGALPVWPAGMPQSLPKGCPNDSHPSCCYQGTLGSIPQPILNMQTLAARSAMSDQQMLHVVPSSGADTSQENDSDEKCKAIAANQTNAAIFSALLASNVLSASTSTSEQLKVIFNNMVKKLKLWNMSPEEQATKNSQWLEEFHRIRKLESEHMELSAKSCNSLVHEPQLPQLHQGLNLSSFQVSNSMDLQKSQYLVPVVQDLSQSLHYFQIPECFLPPQITEVDANKTEAQPTKVEQSNTVGNDALQSSKDDLQEVQVDAKCQSELDSDDIGNKSTSPSSDENPEDLGEQIDILEAMDRLDKEGATGAMGGWIDSLDMRTCANNMKHMNVVPSNDEIDLSTIVLLTELQAGQAIDGQSKGLFLPDSGYSLNQWNPPQQQTFPSDVGNQLWLEQMMQIDALQRQQQMFCNQQQLQQEELRWNQPVLQPTGLTGTNAHLIDKSLSSQTDEAKQDANANILPPQQQQQQPPQQQQQQPQQQQQRQVQGRVFVKGHRKLPLLQQKQMQHQHHHQQQQQALAASSSQFVLEPPFVQLVSGATSVPTSVLQPSVVDAPCKVDMWNLRLPINPALHQQQQQQLQQQQHLQQQHLEQQQQQQQQQLKLKQVIPLQHQQPTSQQQQNSILLGIKQQQQLLTHQSISPSCLYNLQQQQQQQQQQHIYLPQFCASNAVNGGVELQPLKQTQQQYLQQQEQLLVQAHQLQYQLHTAQQLQQLLQQKQVLATSTASLPQATLQQAGVIGSQSPHPDLIKQAQLWQVQQVQQVQQMQHLNQKQQQQQMAQACPAGTQPVASSISVLGTLPFGTGVQKIAGAAIQPQFQLTPQQQQMLLQQQINHHHYQPHTVTDPVQLKAVQTANGFDRPDLTVASTPLSPNPAELSHLATLGFPSIEVDAQTENNHDTALTLACAGGHSELVELLLSRGANIEHRDKKGFTPLILAATGGHVAVVEILLDHGVEIETQSERTKDSPLSLACSGGRYEVVELLLARGANKEHRNVSDYTPLSLAASGGYVNIIKLLLSHGAEINSRTGSKLGISPLMLAAMNGHTAAVTLLLDKGSDINAQIETNRNTALTLACFQGRHEVVSILVDRKANIEHRAKTGLTPLMEAASGGYVEVGKVLLDRGADVNAAPVPSSRDTALTIAADKGHHRFVELLLSRRAMVDVKNKKGNSPLWLACNGGHLEVVQHLVNAKADVDSQDNRKVSCLMVAFRKGHVKVVKWLVKHVLQFPSEQECARCLATINDKDLVKKSTACMEIIRAARDHQAAEANKNANNLLLELARERALEENRRAAVARKREKKRQKKKKKQGNDKEALVNNESNELGDDDSSEDANVTPLADVISIDVVENEIRNQIETPKAIESSDTKVSDSNDNSEKNAVVDVKPVDAKKLRKVKKSSGKSKSSDKEAKTVKDENRQSLASQEMVALPSNPVVTTTAPTTAVVSSVITAGSSSSTTKTSNLFFDLKRDAFKASISGFSTTRIGDLDDFGMLPTELKSSSLVSRDRASSTATGTTRTKASSSSSLVLSTSKSASANSQRSNLTSSPKKGSKKDEGWKEVTRKCKRLNVPGKAISRIIGRGGCNINAIREASGAHIDLDKLKNSTDGVVTIRGSVEATKLAYELIEALIRETDKDIEQIIPLFKAKVLVTQPVPSTIAAVFESATTNPWKNIIAKSSVIVAGSTSGVSSIVSATVCNSIAKLSTTSSVAVPSSGSIGVFSSTTGQSSVWNGGSKINFDTDDGSKPQPIVNFPIGAWTPMALTQGHQNKRSHESQNSRAASDHTPKETSSTINTVAMSTVTSTTTFSSAVQRTTSVQVSVSSTVSQQQQRTDVSAVLVSGEVTKVITTTGVAAWTVQQQQQPQWQQPKTDPLPLPIVSSGPPVMLSFDGKPSFSTSLADGISSLAATATRDYSPFNNLFSTEIAKTVMGMGVKENRLDFASIAAASVVLTMTPPGQSSATATPVASSGDVVDSALQAKAPGYRSLSQLQSVPSPWKAISSDSVPEQITDYGKQYAFTVDGDPKNKQPNIGLPPVSEAIAECQNILGYTSNNNISPPRSSSTFAGELNASDLPPRGHPGQIHREEYISLKNPMTLPHIDSNLNPNAPDFTSKTLLDFSAKYISSSTSPAYFYPPQVPPIPMHFRAASAPQMSSAITQRYGMLPNRQPVMNVSQFHEPTNQTPFGNVVMYPGLTTGDCVVMQNSVCQSEVDGLYHQDNVAPSSTSLEEVTPTSSSLSSPNADDRRSLQPIGMERSSKKQRIITTGQQGYNFVQSNVAVVPPIPWQTTYSFSDIGAGDWSRISSISAPASLMTGPHGDGVDCAPQMMAHCSAPLQPPPAILPYHPELMHPLPPDMIQPQTVRPAVADQMFDPSLQNQQAAMMLHGGPPTVFTNGIMPTGLTMPGPYYPNTALIGDAGSTVSSWAGQQVQKIPPGMPGMQWNQNGWMM